MDYPKEWDELPKRERKRKIKALKSEADRKDSKNNNTRNIVIAVVAIVVAFVIYNNLYSSKNTIEIDKFQFEQDTSDISLEGKVEEFETEGAEHISKNTKPEYKTNPPTSGGHFAQAEKWGVKNKEIDDRAGVHSLEHGGIWISYKDISEEEVALLNEIAKRNGFSVLVSPRQANDDKIVAASWGKMMRLETVDVSLIQKYIDTYKNDSPEKLAK